MTKILLLAGAAAIALLPALPVPAQVVDVGVASAVNPAARGLSQGRGDRVLMVGYSLEHNERIVTGASGRTQVLFVDESSLTVGPNSDMVLDRFVYDPAKGTGAIAASVTKGVFRFVGGKISKTTPVEFRTPTATIGIRGGVGTITVDPRSGATTVMLHFGRITVTNASGVVREITAHGFQVAAAAPDTPPSVPARALAQDVSARFTAFEGTGLTVGGPSQPPTDQTVARSPVPAVGSDTAPRQVPSAPPGSLQTQNQRPTGPPPPGSPAGGPPRDIANTVEALAALPATATTTTTTATPPLPPPLPAQRLALSGRLLEPASSWTVPGGQSVASPGTAGILNGGLTSGSATVSTATRSGDQTTITLSDGQTVTGPVRSGRFSLDGFTATQNGVQRTLNGTGFASANDDFLFLRGRPSDSGGPPGLLFAGTPTPNGGRVASPGARLDAYALEPDAATGNRLPFTPSAIGERFAASAVAAPLFLVRPAGGTVGDVADGRRTSTLQATLAIDGQGAAQTSLLLGTTGVLGAPDGTPVAVDQGVVGSARLSATGAATVIGSRISSVPDPAGNHFFGDDLQYAVLDQNLGAASGSRQPDAGTYQTPGSLPEVPRYGFTHVATRTETASPMGERRTVTMNGFAAAIGEATTASGGALPSYTLTASGNAPESVQVVTDGARGLVTAGMALGAGSGAGFSEARLAFGGTNGGIDRSAYIDDLRYAAMHSAETPSTFDGHAGQTDAVNRSGARSFLVTYDLVRANGFMPAGVTPCECRFLSWGYWTNAFQWAGDAGANAGRWDTVHIGTWVAGEMPTAVQMPTAGSASFTGHAVGSVDNQGVRYLAAGGLGATYDFAARTGTVAVSNFDGRSFSTAVAADAARPFAFTGSSATTRIDGAFATSGADPVAGIMGQFQHRDGGYTAAGVFAGRRN